MTSGETGLRANGNLLYEITDVGTDSAVNPISLVREYNSADKSVTAFGGGWNYNLDITMTPILQGENGDGCTVATGQLHLPICENRFRIYFPCGNICGAY